MSKHDLQLAQHRSSQLTAYIASAREREFPEIVREAARRALVDHLACAIGAADDAPVRPVRRTVARWNAAGRSRIYMGGTTTPALAVLVNGTAAHAMDYDDTHPLGGGHPSGPCWSATLALADELELPEDTLLAAFVTGFEIMARLGGGGPAGVGRSLQRAGLHPTSVFGRAGAAAVASVLMDLTPSQVTNALGIAATTAGGLLGSFGTHGKPFHAGKSAMDGILAAQLAADGFEASSRLYEIDAKGGLLRSLIQAQTPEVPALDFDRNWEILGNSFKMFASCRGTHASTQAAMSVAAAVAGREIAHVHARVHPGALVAAGNLDPKTPLEGKFSVPFCIALGLRGYRLAASDFSLATMEDRSVMELVPRIACEAVETQPNYEAHLDIAFADGTHLKADTAIVIGHPDNPVDWAALRGKFDGLVEPVLGRGKADEVFGLAQSFDTIPGSARRITALLAG